MKPATARTKVSVFDPNGNTFHHAYSDMTPSQCARHYAKAYQGKAIKQESIHGPSNRVVTDYGVIDDNDCWLYLMESLTN